MPAPVTRLVPLTGCIEEKLAAERRALEIFLALRHKALIDELALRLDGIECKACLSSSNFTRKIIGDGSDSRVEGRDLQIKGNTQLDSFESISQHRNHKQHFLPPTVPSSPSSTFLMEEETSALQFISTGDDAHDKANVHADVELDLRNSTNSNVVIPAATADHNAVVTDLSRTTLPPGRDDSISRLALSATSKSGTGRNAGASHISSTSNCLAVLELWPIWTDEAENVASRTSGQTNSSRGTFNLAGAETKARRRVSHRAGDVIHGGHLLDSIVVLPSSRRRLFWDMLSIAFLGYDVLMLPLEPFDLPDNDFTMAMNMTTLVFWTLDVYFSLTTGFYHHLLGVIEMRLQIIAKRYLRSWFALDISLLTVDYLLMAAQEGGAIDFLAFARIGKSFRVIRVLRMLKLLRLIKASSILSDLADRIFTDTTDTIFSILKLIIGIVLANHFLACGWYAVGVRDFGTAAHTWVRTLQAIENSENSFAWYYTSALHWSITQFTPASMEIVPSNVFERCYALGVILLALVAFSTFVSSITGSMTHLRAINMEKARQRNIVRQYITQNKLSLDLGNRIQAFCRQNHSADKKGRRVHEQDIPTFMLLPDTLRREMHGQVYLPIIEPHPFFRLFQNCDDQGAAEICHNAMTEQCFSRGQAVFQTGDPSSVMFFILTGRLDYFQLFNTVTACRLEHPDYVSEMCLWVQWEHKGRLVPNVSCEVAGLDSKKFRSVARRLDAFDSCKKYARAYIDSLRNMWSDAEYRVPADVYKIDPEVVALAFRQEELDISKKASQESAARFFGLFAWGRSSSGLK